MSRLHFIGSGESIARKANMTLVEERPFFGDARSQLRKKLTLYTRIAMKIVDKSGRRGFLAHLKA